MPSPTGQEPLLQCDCGMCSLYVPPLPFARTSSLCQGRNRVARTKVAAAGVPYLLSRHLPLVENPGSSTGHGISAGILSYMNAGANVGDEPRSGRVDLVMEGRAKEPKLGENQQSWHLKRGQEGKD